MKPAHDAVLNRDDDTWPARIARALTDRIITGELQPGERVGQDALAAEFGTSHVPVREAFRRVEARGLLVSEPRKGVRVSLLDEASIVEITRMRGALESLALRHAIPAMEANDLERANAAIEAGDKAQDMQAWEAANRTFHEILYRPCAMPRLLASINMLHESRMRYMHVTAPYVAWDPDSQREHLQLLAAVKKRDVEQACHLMERHIADAGAILLRGLVKWRSVVASSDASPASPRPAE